MFVAVTKITFAPEHKDKVLAFAKEAAPVFRRQPGFQSFTAHLAQDDSHTMSYIAWETEADHLKCMQSPDFAELNPRFQELVESGEGAFELTTYRVLDT